MTEPATPSADRRTVLIGAAATAGVLTLAACASDDSGSEDNTGSGDSDGTDSAALAAVDDIPDGSALVVDSDQGPVVLVRDGDSVSGLSAVCTHQGCTVGVSGAELPCPCHGSSFALDGSVLSPPAESPLPALAVVVVDDEVLRA